MSTRKPGPSGGAATPRRYVSYLRVSTDRQGKTGLGIEAQRQAVAEFLAGENGGNGERLLAEYVEVESGKRSDRPELAKAMDHAKLAGATLLIARLDRLSRNVHFLTGLQEAGVEFRACDIPSANRMVLTVMAAVAEEEARLISDRTWAALQVAKERIAGTGQRQRPEVKRLGNPNGAAAFGTDGPARGNCAGVASIQRETDKFVERLRPIIAELDAAGVAGASAIARALNERGVMTPRAAQARRKAEKQRRHAPDTAHMQWSAMAVIRLRQRLDRLANGAG